MRFHRFYLVNTKIGNSKELNIDSSALASQISKVFRLGPEDEVILFDGSGNDYTCSIVDISKNNIQLKVGEVAPSRYIPQNKIFLFQSLIKKDKFEWIVEKATELGVTDIVPIISERSEKKDLNLERLNKIAIEASEQSGRGTVPNIHSIIDLNSAVKDITNSRNVAVFHLEGSPVNFHQMTDGESKTIFIGPEGGWSPAEMDMFHQNKFSVFSLGKQVLRAETAAVVALSKILM